MIHELKCKKKYFEKIISGEKTFEVRNNDRRYKVGDILALNEYNESEYTGRSCVVYVDYILNDEDYLNDFVIMSIKPCGVEFRGLSWNCAKRDYDYSVPIIQEDAPYERRGV